MVDTFYSVALIIYDQLLKHKRLHFKDYPQTLKVLGNAVYYQSMNGPGTIYFKMDLSQSTQ
jgi:hypothetical protein